MKIWDRIHGKPSEEYTFYYYSFFDACLEVAAIAKK
jgi:hypothetical protein